MLALALAGCNPMLGIERGEPYPATAASGQELEWVRQITGPGEETVTDVAVGFGQVVAVGKFDQTLHVGVDGPMLEPLDEWRSTFAISYGEDGAFRWARAFPGTADVSYQAVAANPTGFVVASTFRGTRTFGEDGEPGHVSLTSTGGFDEAYVLKLDAEGALQWVNRVKGPSAVYDVAAMGNGAVVTGAFTNDLAAAKPTLWAAGPSDAFLVGFGDAGQVTFAKQVGGPGEDSGTGVVVSDRVYATGVFEGSVSLENGSAELVAAGKVDVYVVAYELNGTLAWARRLGGSGAEYAHGLRTLTTELVVAGEYGSLDFSFGEPKNSTGTLPSALQSDVFLCALRKQDGALEWIRSAGGPGLDEGKPSVALAASLDGSLAIAGRFTDQATFGSSTVKSSGLTDAFFAHFDSAGSPSWADRIGGESNDEARDVAMLAQGRLVVVGRLASDTCVIGEGQPNEAVLSVQGLDGFIASYSF